MEIIKQGFSREERERRLEILMKADQETKLAEKELNEWRKDKIIPNYSKIPQNVYKFEEIDRKESPVKTPLISEINKNPKKPEKDWHKHYKELKARFIEQEKLHSKEKERFQEEIERLEKLIDEIQKNRSGSNLSQIKILEQEIEQHKVQVNLKCAEIENLLKIQKQKDIEIGKIKVKYQNLKEKLQKIKTDQEEKAKKEENEMKWIKNEPAQKAVLKKKKVKKEPQLCKDCKIQSDEEHWRNVALELTEKYFSALKGLKEDLGSFKENLAKTYHNKFKSFTEHYKKKLIKKLLKSNEAK
ncbi:unnamed protein product [Blepharisma stoltei]|uniref:Uncharacterized protein n=1 Tax=Blepharisma stoltei TaxID=1481888 RepID=A0AAU9K6V0_9CILI|nr:unnamed protein product [Blepharisma stoltei]